MNAVAPVVRTVTVEVPQQHAFTVFTERFDAWWPRSHTTAGGMKEAVLEPREGGRWFERDHDGGEHPWGHVLTWAPPDRVVLAWQLDADWEYDPGLVTEIEVRFVAETPHRTRVELEHRHLERFAERAAEVRAELDAEGGWTGILSTFAEVAAAPA